MNVIDNSKCMIFKKEGQYGPMYSIGLSKKDKDGKYENGYMPVRFKKDVELDDRTEIYIKNAWLTFYKKDKVTVPYIFINEFSTIDEEIKPTKELLEKKVEDPYEVFANEHGEELETELPF